MDFYVYRHRRALKIFHAPQRLSKSEKRSPLVILGDEGYPFRPDIMRLFPRAQLTNGKTICNYRLSRARRNVKCVFGLLSKNFGVLDRAIGTTPEGSDILYEAMCIAQYDY